MSVIAGRMAKISEQNRMTLAEYKRIAQGKLPESHEDAEKRAKKADKDEAAMQTRLENLLHLRGWWRRSQHYIRSDELPPRGWQIHLHKAKRNPILLDLLLLGNDGRYMELELKQQKGRYSSDEQRILCEDHGRPVFRSVEDAYEHVIAWEGMAV